MPLISVIVPVYNAREYLSFCIESIVGQLFSDFELLLIDDGSTDASKEISENYKRVDGRIKLYSKKNGGVSSARNYGIKYASAKYICFVDADDFIEATYLKRLYETIIKDKSDLAICGYYTRYGEKKTIHSLGKELVEIGKVKSHVEIYGNNIITHTPWNKLYRNSVIKKNNLSFNPKFSIGEDWNFNLDYLQCCQNISIISDPLYNYCTHQASAMQKPNKTFEMQNRKTMGKSIKFFSSSNSESISSYMLYHWLYVLVYQVTSELNTEQKKIAKNRILRDSFYTMNITNLKRAGLPKRLLFFIMKTRIIPIWILNNKRIYGLLNLRSFLGDHSR